MQELIQKNFNHLKIHTQYSICEGTIKIDDLKEYCKKNKIKSVGLSDPSNLSGALEFSENISKSGTQPIIGSQILFKFNDVLGLLPLIALNLKVTKELLNFQLNHIWKMTKYQSHTVFFRNCSQTMMDWLFFLDQ